jgi:steroid delta-isomerase-like uncharacterized protein
MSRENAVALIQSYYRAFNAGQWETFLGLLTDDVVHDINHGDRETGRDAFRAFMDRMNRCYAEQIVDLVVMASEDGRRAAAEFVVEGRYIATDAGLPEATGQTYRLPAGAFFAIEGAQVARVTNYYNLADWLRQVGV